MLERNGFAFRLNTKEGSVAPSAPGAFHALHMHWRWARDFQSGAVLTGEASGDPQFSAMSQGGILVDPRIDYQWLEIAVVVNKDLPADIRDHSTQIFSDCFTQRKGQGVDPAPIADGGDLILYYSAQIPVQSRSFNLAYNASKFFEGQVFVHGLFFAHELEKSTLLTGPLGPVYLRPSHPKETWFRQPEPG